MTLTREDILKYECPTCHAKPGHRCMRPSGHRTFGGVPHATRVKVATEKFQEANHENS